MGGMEIYTSLDFTWYWFLYWNISDILWHLVLMAGIFLLWYPPLMITSRSVSWYSCSSVSFMIYVTTCFVESETGITHVWQVLFVGINPGGGCSFLMAPTSSLFLVYTIKTLEIITEDAACILGIVSARISYHICDMWILLNGFSCMDHSIFAI